MKKQERKRIGSKIRHELQKGTHTFTMCSCGRIGCRSSQLPTIEMDGFLSSNNESYKCWECWLKYLEEGKE